MHINVLLTESAMHLIWHFMLEMAVGLFNFHSVQGICTSNCCHIPARKVVRNATMGQQNNSQSLTPSYKAEFHLLFRSVVRDGPVQ